MSEVPVDFRSEKMKEVINKFIWGLGEVKSKSMSRQGLGGSSGDRKGDLRPTPRRFS